MQINGQVRSDDGQPLRPEEWPYSRYIAALVSGRQMKNVVVALIQIVL